MAENRVIVRWVPGFRWVQIAVRRQWGWDLRGHWSVRGFAKARIVGPFWICTMRSDALARGKRSGLFE